MKPDIGISDAKNRAGSRVGPGPGGLGGADMRIGPRIGPVAAQQTVFLRDRSVELRQHPDIGMGKGMRIGMRGVARRQIGD